MPSHLRNIDFVKTFRLKQVGIALASIWLIVLIAAVASTIYREIDGPVIRTTIAENVNLAKLNYSLNESLDHAQKVNEAANGKIDQLNTELIVSQSEYDNTKRRLESTNRYLEAVNADLKRQLKSYLPSAPLLQIGP